jgi:manganese/zinc/iron transport system substrate-binding protein
MLKFLMSQKMFFEFSKTLLRWRALAAAGLAVALLTVSSACGCRGPVAEGEPAQDPRLRVVATTTVVADLVRQVAGDRVSLEVLMAPGIDPHSYKATPRDADRLLRADLVVASGLHLEGRLATLLERLADRVPVVAVADGLPADELLEAGAGLPDPHVWFDAGLWSLAPAVVAATLATLDPIRAEAYAAEAEVYATRLRGLDEAIRQRIETIPAERRVLITAHDAFRYFGRAYGIEVVGVQGTNTTSEAGLGDINRLVDRVVSQKIPAVFVETSVADRNIVALLEGAAARGHELSLGGRLYSDSLGEPGSEAETLEEALKANVEVIVRALAPAEQEPAP